MKGVSIEILELERQNAANLRLVYRYRTDLTYEVTRSKAEGSWSFQLQRKPLRATVSKGFESQLFEPYVENPFAYKCIVDGRDAAFMQVGYESWNRRLRVWELLVLEEHRRAGLGARLMDLAKRKAQELGARMIVLETQSCNVPAIDFYLRQGFELIGFDLACYSNEDVANGEVRLEFGLPL